MQQFPRDWNADSSPSIFTARPFSTVTHTPHSILPQPRHAVRIRLTSGTAVFSPAVAPSACAPSKLTVAAIAVAAASLVNARLVMDVFLPMGLSSLFEIAERAALSVSPLPIQRSPKSVGPTGVFGHRYGTHNSEGSVRPELTYR